MVKATNSIVVVLAAALLFTAIPAQANSIFSIDALFTSHGATASDPFNGIPDFHLTGQFKADLVQHVGGGTVRTFGLGWLGWLG